MICAIFTGILVHYACWGWAAFFALLSVGEILSEIETISSDTLERILKENRR